MGQIASFFKRVSVAVRAIPAAAIIADVCVFNNPIFKYMIGTSLDVLSSSISPA